MDVGHFYFLETAVADTLTDDEVRRLLDDIPDSGWTTYAVSGADLTKIRSLAKEVLRHRAAYDEKKPKPDIYHLVPEGAIIWTSTTIPRGKFLIRRRTGGETILALCGTFPPRATLLRSQTAGVCISGNVEIHAEELFNDWLWRPLDETGWRFCGTVPSTANIEIRDSHDFSIRNKDFIGGGSGYYRKKYRVIRESSASRFVVYSFSGSPETPFEVRILVNSVNVRSAWMQGGGTVSEQVFGSPGSQMTLKAGDTLEIVTTATCSLVLHGRFPYISRPAAGESSSPFELFVPDKPAVDIHKTYHVIFKPYGPGRRYFRAVRDVEITEFAREGSKVYDDLKIRVCRTGCAWGSYVHTGWDRTVRLSEGDTLEIYSSDSGDVCLHGSFPFSPPGHGGTKASPLMEIESPLP